MEMFSNVFFSVGNPPKQIYIVTFQMEPAAGGEFRWSASWSVEKFIQIDQMVHVTSCYIMFAYFWSLLLGFPIWLIFLVHGINTEKLPPVDKKAWASGSALFRLLDQGDGAVTLDEFLGEFFGWQDINRTWFPWNCDCQECVFVTFINRGETNKRNIIDYLHLFYSILISLHSIFYCILFYSLLT